MATPWRHCWRWTIGSTSTGVLETICGFNGRSATFAASSFRGTGAVAGSGKEVGNVRPCQCQDFTGRECCQPNQGQPVYNIESAS